MAGSGAVSDSGAALSDVAVSGPGDSGSGSGPGAG